MKQLEFHVAQLTRSQQ